MDSIFILGLGCIEFKFDANSIDDAITTSLQSQIYPYEKDFRLLESKFSFLLNRQIHFC